MSELRWIIGIVGVGLIVALYLWGRRRSGHTESKSDNGRVEPRLDAGSIEESREAPPPGTMAAQKDWIQFPETEIRREPAGTPPRELPKIDSARSVAPQSPQRIFVLYVRAAAGTDFTGPELQTAFDGEGLVYGKYGAFHYLDSTGDPVFSVANMMEPGSFPKDEMAAFATAGITAFMVLPGPGGLDDLARMIACCRRLASLLGGEVLDENRSTLTNQGATHMKEELIEFLRQARLDSDGAGPGTS